MIGPLALCVLLAAPLEPSRTSLETAASNVALGAGFLGSTPEGRLVVAVHVQADTPELARAFQTLLVSDLAKLGVKAVLPLQGPVEKAEAAARAAGAEWLWRLTARLTGTKLLVSGDRVPTWVNFWTGQDPIRAPGGAAVGVEVVADAQALALANLAPSPAKGEVATKFAVRTLSKLPEKVVAVAVGDLDGDARPEVALLTPTQVVVLSASGQPLARRDLSDLPRASKPPREPAGALAVQGGGPVKPLLLAFLASRARGEALQWLDGRLEPVSDVALDQPYLAASLRGSFLAGKNLFAPEVRSGARFAVLPFAPVAVAATSLPQGPAFAIANPDGVAVLLDADLKPTPLPGQFGAALALGDLDGDGAAEVVATGLARTDDRIRLVRPGGATPLFESDPVPANLVSAAAGDLDGCGRDEAVLAGWNADGGTTLFVLGAQR